MPLLLVVAVVVYFSFSLTHVFPNLTSASTSIWVCSIARRAPALRRRFGGVYPPSQFGVRAVEGLA